MSAFQTVTTTQAPLDPYKRVRYSMGLVLGVDEFEQEQLYLLNRDRLHNRLLHGYGTVCGLSVSERTGSEGVEVLVSAGVAVDPQGRVIRVPTAQCARVGAWIQNRQADLEERFGTAPALLPLYVVLCYRECETDQVPVPGGPCRSQEDSVTPSRILDDFELSLRLDPPAQPQEEMTRRFGDLLRRMEIADEATEYLTQPEIEELVRGLLVEESPPSSPPGSPPASPPTSPPAAETYTLRPEEACALLQAAFRTWVIQVRPQIMGPAGTCVDGNPGEQCVLLAEVGVPLDASWQISGAVMVDDGERPLLANTRLLQEWLLCGQVFHREQRTVHDFASLVTMGNDTIRIWIHHPALLDLAADALAVDVEDERVAIIDVSRALAGVNVFDAQLGPGEGGLEEGEALIEHRDRIALTFATGQITINADPAQTLYNEIVDDRLDYVGRAGETITVHGFANLVSDHGQLDGLGDDDHTQYFNQERGDARYALRNHTHNLGELRNVTEDGRQEGTVLTWNEEARRWEPRRPSGTGPHVHALDDLSDASTQGATPGSLLAFTGNQWAPQPTGQIVPGSTLVWNGQRWVAQRIEQPRPEGNFVIAPVPQYAIVAAGIFDGNGQRLAPPYLLAVERLGPGEYLLIFPGYIRSEMFTYIVKGTIFELDRDQGAPAVFHVARFLEEGIHVRTVETGVDAQVLRAIVQGEIGDEISPFRYQPADHAFMVEISVYGDDLSEVLAQIG